ACVGATQGAVRSRRGDSQPQSRSGPGVRRETARETGPGEAGRGRLPGARQEVRRTWFGLVLFACTFVVLAFLTLPVIAIFTHVSPVTLVSQFSNPVVVHALVVSAKTTIAAQLLILFLGTPAAWLLASRRFPARPLLITIVELPLVLPPAVAGIGLLVAFGR